MIRGSRGFAPVLILIVLGIIGVAAYLMLNPKPSSLYPSPTPTQTPDSTANLSRVESKDWKTYRNTSQKYTLEYPPSWEVSEESYSESSYILHSSLFKENRKNQLTVEVYSKFLIPAVPEDKILRTEEIAVGDVSATKNWHNSFGPTIEVLIPFQGKLYRVTAVNDETLDQILSTFKFLEE